MNKPARDHEQILRARKNEAMYVMEFFDNFSLELRAAVNEFPCSILEIEQLLAFGWPEATIIAELKKGNLK